MSKRKTSAEIGVVQLAFTFGIEPKDEASVVEGNEPATSSTPAQAMGRPMRKRKWHSLADKVYSPRNLAQAWDRVRSNAGAGGVDGVSVSTFTRKAEEHLAHLHADLRSRTYRPQPVRRVYIPKSGGGKRPLGIPTVRDRIVQQALVQVLAPIFEAKFSKRSHGFRPGRGCESALAVVEQAIRHGYAWVVDADVRAFFDSVSHEKLLGLLNEEVADGTVLRMIRRILQAGVIEPGVSEQEPTELGTPQGGPLSPLLANVYLHQLDERMVAAGHGLVRYADDFIIFAKSEAEAQDALALAREVLEGELQLSLHPEKTRVVSVDAGFDFLGFHYYRNAKRDVRCKAVRRKSEHRFREKIRSLTPRLRTQRPVKASHVNYRRLSRNQRLKEILHDVSVYLRDWHGYFRQLDVWYSRPFREFDQFVRMRVRMAITGRVGAGWWNHRITIRLLASLGLASLDELHAAYLLDPGRPHARNG